MNATQLKQTIKKIPFTPMTIHVTDGLSVKVEDPDKIAINTAKGVIFVFTDDTGYEIIDINHIARIELS